MDHLKQYQNLISKAQSRTIPSGYIEYHHIIPRCMGGTDDADNLAPLTAREHFVAHKLLAKIHPDNKKIQQGIRLLKLLASIPYSRFYKGNENRKAWNTGLTKHTHPSLMRMSLSRYGEGNPAFGTKSSDETRLKQKISSTGEKSPYFKGYYVTPWGEFASTHLAAELGYLTAQSILNYCVNRSHSINDGRNKKLPIEWKGKSWSEIGFGFRSI